MLTYGQGGFPLPLGAGVQISRMPTISHVAPFLYE